MAEVSGSNANLAAKDGAAAPQSEEKDTRRAFNYPLVNFCDMSDEMKAEAVDMVVTAVEKHITNYEVFFI
jgi:dynein light chain 4